MSDPLHALLIGGGGLAGAELCPALERAGYQVTAPGQFGLDITDPASIREALADAAPTVVVNAAAWTDVDAAENHKAIAERVNADGPALLAAACAEREIQLVHLSTDYVFGGRGSRRHHGTPYAEEERPRPANTYGRSKLAGERRVRDALRGRELIVRTSWLYGGRGACFPRRILARARTEAELTVVDDQFGCPTWNADLADGLVALLAAGAAGTVHLASPEPTSWHTFASAICDGARARGASLAVETIRPVPSTVAVDRAPRPTWSALDSARFAALTGHPPPPWPDALDRFLDRHLADLLVDDGPADGS